MIFLLEIFSQGLFLSLSQIAGGTVFYFLLIESPLFGQVLFLH